MSTRHLLEIDDLTADELSSVLDRAAVAEPPAMLDGLGAALIFEKPSARTRNSAEMAVVQLGGHPVSIRGEEVGIDTRESAEDVARTLACYHALIGARVFDHGVLERMVAVSPVPIVNLLSDEAHPLQAVADLLTIREAKGHLKGVSVAYVGDANNVARSLAVAAGMMGMEVRLGCPSGYDADELMLDRIRTTGADPLVTSRIEEAVEGVDVVYTDVWTSMGQEVESAKRRQAFEGFTIDASVMERAADDAVFLHCLPAHRGEEVSAGVVDGERSWVWTQATQRMHAARAAFWFLLEVSS